MTEHHKDQILKIVAHYLPSNLRQHIMMEAPAAYNDWMNRDIVEVVFTDDNKRVDGVPRTKISNIVYKGNNKDLDSIVHL